jgi:hypothetical protein
VKRLGHSQTLPLNFHIQVNQVLLYVITYEHTHYYYFNFFYSYVHTIFASFLPPFVTATTQYGSTAQIRVAPPSLGKNYPPGAGVEFRGRAHMAWILTSYLWIPGLTEPELPRWLHPILGCCLLHCQVLGMSHQLLDGSVPLEHHSRSPRQMRHFTLVKQCHMWN